MPDDNAILKAAADALQAAEKAQSAAAIVAQVRPGLLTRLNTFVTVVAAIGTAVIGLRMKWGEGKLQEIEIQARKTQEQTAKIDKDIRALDQRAKIEDASYKFAREFLAHAKDNLATNPRGTQLAVAALNIIAQASSSDGGESSSILRAELPLHMALLLGDPGSIVTLDPDLKHLDQWFEFAAADADDRTRATAIRALCALCRQAVRAKKLDRIDLCTAKIELLPPLLSDGDAKEMIEQRTIALAAKSKLQAFLSQHDAELREAKLPAIDSREPKELVTAVLKRFETTVSALQETAFKLRAADQAVTSAQSAGTAAAATPSAQVQQTLATVNEALQAVAQARPATSGTDASSDPVAQKDEIDALIARLRSPDAATRHKARSSLALLRQAAVKPLCEELQKRSSPTDEASYNKTRLGVATALSRMAQPIAIDADQAILIVELISAPDAETRQAAADFLMNMEGSANLQNAYAALSLVVNPKGGRPKPDRNSAAGKKTGSAVINAAIILATWARVLTDDNVGPDSVTPMSIWALKTVEGLRSDLQSQDHRQWAETIDTLTDLLQRANRAQKRTAKA